MAADPNNTDYIPLDDAAPTKSAETTHGESSTPSKKQKKHAKQHDEEPPQSSSDESELSSESEKESKKQKQNKKDKKAEKRKRKSEADESHDTPNGTASADVADDIETPKQDKKKKKRKLEKSTEDAGSQEEATPKEKKEKKKQRKEKRHAEYVSSPVAEGGSNTNGGEQWNVQSLEGGDKRKEKFLRLLGAKKPNGTAVTDNHIASSNPNFSQVQSELERQFVTGMRMKHEGHGQKKGLGA